MKMKQIVSLLLSFVMVFGLLSGCGNNQPEATDPMPDTTPSQTQATTEATEPAPQISEALQEVCDLGIADMDLLLRTEDVCTRAEAAGMLAKVHEMQYGQKSQYLYDMVDAFDEADWSKPVTHYYLAQAIFCSAMESVFDFEYENWYVWACNCHENDLGYAWPDASVMGIRLDGTPGEGSIWELCPDLQEIDNPPADDSDARHMVDYGSTPAVAYATWLYDRRDGNKVMELDENYYFRPYETMTIEQAAETALRYYYSFEPAAEMVAYTDTHTFDTSIITPELLRRRQPYRMPAVKSCLLSGTEPSSIMAESSIRLWTVCRTSTTMNMKLKL